jgi:hypothetical protein
MLNRYHIKIVLYLQSGTILFQQFAHVDVVIMPGIRQWLRTEIHPPVYQVRGNAKCTWVQTIWKELKKTKLRVKKEQNHPF